MKKIALITGASSGIGKATAILLAENQYHLILIGRRKERLTALATALESQYAIQTQILSFDVRQASEVQKHLEALSPDWKKIDVLVNNAGLSQGLDPIHEGCIDDWDTMIDTNIKGFLYVTRIVAAWMKNLKKGHIVNIGSIAGKEVYPNGNVYCATKHAVDALNKAMRIDLLPYHIKVTGIHPGAVATEFSQVRFHGDTQRAEKVYEGFDPLLAEDIADAIWYCISRKAHVNINDLLIMPTAQANGTTIQREL